MSKFKRRLTKESKFVSVLTASMRGESDCEDAIMLDDDSTIAYMELGQRCRASRMIGSIFYCGNSTQIVKTLQVIERKYHIRLAIERFDWWRFGFDIILIYRKRYLVLSGNSQRWGYVEEFEGALMCSREKSGIESEPHCLKGCTGIKRQKLKWSIIQCALVVNCPNVQRRRMHFVSIIDF
jgi:hypothetical protein